MAVRTAALLGAGADAEDVVQEAFVRAHRSLGRFRAGAQFRPWLLRIVANETRNHHRSAVRRRSRERAVALPEVLPEALLDPGEAVADRERKRRLLAAVAALSFAGASATDDFYARSLKADLDREVEQALAIKHYYRAGGAQENTEPAR